MARLLRRFGPMDEMPAFAGAIGRGECAGFIDARDDGEGKAA
ncbi:MAG: hypothetical protein AAGC95_18270 [Pseudomonadota bacterium]